jgi:hypothetical protein
MVGLPVPDYFQEDDETALRSQVSWLEQELGLGTSFFARLLRVEERTFGDWRRLAAELPAERQDVLRSLWQTVLHLLSFLNFDEEGVRRLLEQPIPCAADGRGSPLAPPWCGSSLRAYLEARGPEALAEVEQWVTGFRFGDPYAA